MKKYPLLSNINSPEDIKSMNKTLLDSLSNEISLYIQEVIKERGGHFSSPLGVVDLSIALHYVYNSPLDKFIWDVGHQAYAHKILTGRREEFKSIRNKGGISGFLKRDESEHDIFGAGHASTSISSALGFAHARDRKKEKYQVLAIIGDGAMTGGIAYEGINNLGFHKTQLTIVLNDNSHSISRSVGALSHYLNRVVTNPTYNKIRKDIWEISGKLPMSKHIRKFMRKTEEGIKGYFTPGALFEELGLRYIGPIDGHNMEELIYTFNAIKDMNTPVLVHVFTKKGKGFISAEKDAIKYYSMGGSNKIQNNISAPDYSTVFGYSIAQLAKKDKKIICVTAAMEIGTGMKPFIEQFPDRYIDVGIAEEHAIVYSSGLSAEGFKPIIPIYSTFMQRAYDYIFHDALLQKLPLIYCMDRAGLVGPDGPTHHGVFDIAFMRSFPDMVVSAPKDGNELRNLLFTATSLSNNFSIRYPKDTSYSFDIEGKPKMIEVGEWEVLVNGADSLILAVGSMVGMIMHAKDYISSSLGYTPTIVNARFIKPLDNKMLDKLVNQHSLIITIEEGIINGGFGSAISEYLHKKRFTNHLITIGVPDQFIQHGTREELLEEVGLTPDAVVDALKETMPEEIYEY